MKNSEKIVITILVVIVALMAVYFGINKLNYYSDEIWTYGLANHLSGIYPEVEYGAKYSGYGPLEDFVTAKDGARFNFINVWKNQANDVHPPLYYIMINAVCSLFPGTFSKWYGISVNLFFMAFIAILLYIIAKKITDNSAAAFGMTTVYCTSVMFMDTLVFIRMYTQLALCVVLLAYLFLEYWYRKLDRKFYLRLAAILIFGMFTQYYFLIFAFGFCFSFAMKLRKEKRHDELKKSGISIAVAALIYSVLWYHFYIHLFMGHRGRQAIYHAILPKNIINGPLNMISFCNQEALGGFFGLFFILGIVLLIIKKRHGEKLLRYETSLFLSALFYLFVVGTIAPFMSARYITPVAWIFVFMAYLTTRALIRRIVVKAFVEYILIICFVILNISNFSRYGWRVPNDYYYDGRADVINELEGKSAVVYVDDKWKPIIFFEELRHTGEYIYINDENASDVFESMEGDYYILTCVEKEAEEKLIEGLDAELIYDHAGRSYYKIRHS